MEIRFLAKQELMHYAKSFCDLYRSCFNDYIDERVVLKRYLENPYDDLCMCVAIEDDRLISNYAVSPSRVVVGDKSYKSALSLNTMTHPDFCGKGLFVTLAKALYDKLMSEGYKIVYGCPNYLSNQIFCSKLDWRDVYEIPTMELVLDNKVQIEYRGVRQVNFDEIEYLPNDVIHVEKNHEYVIWRYAKHPSNKYFAVNTDNGGWAIYKFYQDMINIVEFHPCNKSDVINLIGYISYVAKESEKNKITLWSRINSEEHCCLEKLMFRNRYPITYFGALDLGLGKEIGLDMWDYRNWSINMGDDNVY